MIGKGRISPLRWVFFILLGVGLVVLCCYLAAGRGAAAAARVEGESIYEADAPKAGMPALKNGRRSSISVGLFC